MERLKILWAERPVRVRSPPPALVPSNSHDFTDGPACILTLGVDCGSLWYAPLMAKKITDKHPHPKHDRLVVFLRTDSKFYQAQTYLDGKLRQTSTKSRENGRGRMKSGR